VEAVVVHPGFSGRGIGSGLLQRAQEMSEHDYPGLSLLVDMQNDGAIRLYQRFGFRIASSMEEQHLMVLDFGAAAKASAVSHGVAL
jgi:ribosomal protein S18 acetylase RimI-like enzyme